MVATPTFLFAYATLASSVLGSSLIYNPVTPLHDVEPLTSHHPAYGMPVPESVIKPILKKDPNLVVNTTNDSTPAQRFRMRTLEATNPDIERLEAHFGEKMETNFDTLKSKYSKAEFQPASPWPSSYWPVFEDGINNIWKEDEKCPAEKYASAYGLDPKEFMDKVSKASGILSQSSRKACTKDDDCTSLKDGSGCGKRRGEEKGYCIPKWFGICHAWAPAATIEPEPKCKVTKGNVTFLPYDIKALVTQIYDGADIGTVFTGARFDGPDEPAEKDKFGRYTNAARRDVGAGFFHIAVTNIMGKFKKSFIIDVTSGAEVWNQPVRRYEVKEMKIVDTAEATKEYYNVEEYPFNKLMKKLAYVKMRFEWIVEAYEDGPLVEDAGKLDHYTRGADYEYLLELDGDDNIIGGEWLKDSHENHPDFLWFIVGKPPLDTVTNIGLKYKEVRELLDASVACKDLGPDSNGTVVPSASPSASPSPTPSASGNGTVVPSNSPRPSNSPTPVPSSTPSGEATRSPSGNATGMPTPRPSGNSTGMPTPRPSNSPSSSPAGEATPSPSGSKAPVPSPSRKKCRAKDKNGKKGEDGKNGKKY